MRGMNRSQPGLPAKIGDYVAVAAVALRQTRSIWPALADWLGSKHARGAPSHLQRWASDAEEPHSALNYFLPGDLDSQIAALVEHYNRRYHESADIPG